MGPKGTGAVDARGDDELVRAKEAADAANLELEAFSYSVAHDLRAPLRAIDGFSQALLEDCSAELGPKGREHLRYIRESSQEMARLINGLLELSRVTRRELQREQVDLAALARQTVEGLHRAEPARRVELVIADELVVEGDAGLLGLVIENLIGNAWKFTSKKPVTRIEVGLCPGEGPPTYFVRDNGAGFDMRYAKRLFGPFQRLHSSAEFEGAGIGLAKVRRIVRRHTGRVWAEGEREIGSTFYFTLGEHRA